MGVKHGDIRINEFLPNSLYQHLHVGVTWKPLQPRDLQTGHPFEGPGILGRHSSRPHLQLPSRSVRSVRSVCVCVLLFLHPSGVRDLFHRKEDAVPGTMELALPRGAQWRAIYVGWGNSIWTPIG